MNNQIMKSFLIKELNLNKDENIKITAIGGITNKNYLILTKKMKLVLRVPGVATENFINRHNEKNNSELVFKMGINPETIYFDTISGIKITQYIPDSETFSPGLVRKKNNIENISLCFRQLHQSNIKFCNEFNAFSEYKKYQHILNLKHDHDGIYHNKMLVEFFYKTEKILDRLNKDRCPCHNDLVAENIVKSGDKIYLIDWEYSGMNDPMWDLAPHFLECQFNSEEEQIFLTYYFERNIPKESKQKILLFKFMQYVLWPLWAKVKEQYDDNFEKYDINRFKNAYQFMRQYQEQYEK
nr:choline kinase family protein [Candidatus Hamiltonella defensa]